MERDYKFRYISILKTKDWQLEALSHRTKYVRIVRRTIKGKIKWFCQLIQEGLTPLLRNPVDGIVGLDIGPSTIAAVSDNDAILEKFCPQIIEPWKEIRKTPTSNGSVTSIHQSY